MFLRFFFRPVQYSLAHSLSEYCSHSQFKKIAYCMDQPVRSLQLFFFAKIWVF